MLSNKDLKWINSLKNKKYRHIHRAFIAEGPKLVNDLLINGLQPIKILKLADYILSDNSFEDKVVNISDSTLKKLSSQQSPNKILVVFAMPELPQLELHPKGTWGFAFDFIQDPGNLGTIIRTLCYLGVNTIYCSDDSVDLYNPKVVQACMGVLGKINIQYLDLEDFLGKQKVPVYLTEMNGKSIEDIKLEPGIIVFGNEGNGVRAALKASIKNQISIPKLGSGESLNIAITTAIIAAWVKLKHF